MELKRIKAPVKILDDFYVFDTETDGLEARPEKFVFGVVYGKEGSKPIFSVDEFKEEFLKPEYKNKIVFCHNAEYDLNVLYGNIYELDNKAIYNGRFIKATNGNCTFADSTNIYFYSVAKLGKYLGIEKSFDKERYDKGFKVGDITNEDIEGCRIDCEIVYKSLLRIFEKCGAIRVTLAGLSMASFRRYTMPYDIKYHHEYCEVFRNSYYGGRTEAFKIGKTKAVVYDINSMYPFAMKYTRFPNPSKLKHSENVDTSFFLRHFLKNYEGCGRFDIEHENINIGLLPIKKDGKLIFPVGNLNGWWNFNELRFAIETGFVKVKKVHEIYYSKPIESPFIDFVDKNYEMRFKSGEDIDKVIYKLKLNSLYGKWAEKIESESIYIKDINEAGDYINELRQAGHKVEIQLFNNEREDCFLRVYNKSGDKSFNTNAIPLFSSYITSSARIQLTGCLIQYMEYSPVYCDTDSLFFEKEPPIKTGEKLGEWKKENKLCTEIRGLKNYSYIVNDISHNKIKGVPKSANCSHDLRFFSYRSMIKSKESLRRNLKAGKFIERSKKLSGEYSKRIVLKNGYTQPLIF